MDKKKQDLKTNRKVVEVIPSCPSFQSEIGQETHHNKPSIKDKESWESNNLLMTCKFVTRSYKSMIPQT